MACKTWDGSRDATLRSNTVGPEMEANCATRPAAVQRRAIAALRPSSPWQRKTNLWRTPTSPARRAKRLRSVNRDGDGAKEGIDMKLVLPNTCLEDYKKNRSAFLKELIASTPNVSVRAREFRRWINENSPDSGNGEA